MIINNIFQNIIAKGIMIVYLDNILIFTWTLKKHHRVVFRILKILAKYKLYLRLEKCKFDKQ